MCGEPGTYGTTPGRTGLASCTPTSTGPAVRIEDERPGGAYFRSCEVLGTVTNEITYSKLPGTAEGLRIQYTATSARSLTVNLECDPGAQPQLHEEGGHYVVPDRLPETFSSGAATLTWRTSVICAGGGLAALIIGSILGAFAFYLLGGVAYGRHKNPPSPGDGAFAHPEGKGIIGWHPHHEYAWGEAMGLVSDGFKFTLARVRGEKYDPGRGLKTDDGLLGTTDVEEGGKRGSRKKSRGSDPKSSKGRDKKTEKKQRSSSSRSKRDRSKSSSSKSKSSKSAPPIENESGEEKKWKAQVDMSWMPPKPELAAGARETGVKVDFGSGKHASP